MKLGNNISAYVVLGILGLLMIVWPGATLAIVVKLAGIALILVAVSGVLDWVKLKSFRPTETARLLGSVVAAVFGLWMLFNTTGFEKFIPVVLGLVMIVYGGLELFKAYKFGRDRMGLILSALTVIFGLIIACNPFTTIKATVVCAGVALLYTAVTGILDEKRFS